MRMKKNSAVMLLIQEGYEDKRYHFLALGNERQYTES